MKNSIIILTIGILVLLVSAVPGAAEEKPVQLSFITPIQIVPEEDSISALRLNLIYGRNASVRGFDLGIVNHTTTGLSKGVQVGCVSMADADFLGFQYSFVNVTRNDFEGFQWGFVNYVGNGRGLQLGFFNYAETMHGLQIGLINVIREGGVLPVLPIVNWSF